MYFLILFQLTFILLKVMEMYFILLVLVKMLENLSLTSREQRKLFAESRL